MGDNNDETDDEIDNDDEDIEIVHESIQTYADSTDKKCTNCRQSNPQTFVPGSGVGVKDILLSQKLNIEDPDDDDSLSLQYKITDFAIYCKDRSVHHLFPLFTDDIDI